jgi:molybdopterin-guanine dinucleotide biosynthesis protein A
MLSRIRAAVIEAGFKARVIRRDLVPRCGPLGGIYTGLKTTAAAGVMFLACDMPFLSGKLLRFIAEKGVTAARVRPVFSKGPSGIGFPVLLPKEAADMVFAAIKAGTLSLSSLCARLGSATAAVPAELRGQLENINTAEELGRAKQELRLLRGVDLTRGKPEC